MRFQRMSRIVISACFVLTAAALSGNSSAADALQPYVLAQVSTQGWDATIQSVKDALVGQGFDVAGEYSPYEGAHVIVVTDDFLRKQAGKEEGSAYLAGLRVGLAQSDKGIQVSYINPEYYRYAYRITRDMGSVSEKLRAALGAEQDFGTKRGLTASKLKRYHYTFGMEYFDDPMELAKYGSHAQAVKTVEKNLQANVAGSAKVYRIDAPGAPVTVFGVALSEKMAGDDAIMKVIDVDQLSHVAHLPYEVVVFDGEVKALHPRFRIAIDFPDVRMVGSNSFASITRSPDAIKLDLTEVAGGDISTHKSMGGFNVQ